MQLGEDLLWRRYHPLYPRAHELQAHTGRHGGELRVRHRREVPLQDERIRSISSQ